MRKILENALNKFRNGNFIVIYDDDKREGEADLVFHPKFVTPEKIETLRKDAGGLICMAVGKTLAEQIGLRFISEIMKAYGMTRIICIKTAYGDEPAFSIAINHKKVFTGITDNDRALTIHEFAKVVESVDKEHANKNANKKKEFEKNFYSPGHVFLLIGRGIENRRGHTEIGLKFSELAGMSETIVMCEMLGRGNALTKKQAMKYAKQNNIPFIKGSDIYGKK